VTAASVPLGTFLLLSLVLHELVFVFFLLFFLGSLCEDGHVHKGVEIWVDLRGKQSPQFRSQALLEHLLLLAVLIHFLRGVTSQLYELVGVFLHGLVALAEFTELVRLAFQRGFWDVVATNSSTNSSQVMAEGS
jgi:hypothetical protein